MARTMTVLAAGAILGVLVTLLLNGFPPSNNVDRPAIVRDIQSLPSMSQAAAEEHRVQRYVQLESIAELMALPTEFARAEALHALAGRSESAAVQKLAFDALRIADDVERLRHLEILFFRLAETDPRSAVALASTDPFDDLQTLHRVAWQAWARRDLDEALFAAKTRPTRAERHAAAQSLYRAFGYLGNDTTARIEDELDIEPDRHTRARYLYGLADRTPVEAIAFINAHERGSQRNEYVSWLAYYVSRSDPEAARAFVSQFGDKDEARRYERIIDQELATANPLAVAERLLANGVNRNNHATLFAAGKALAALDVEQAKALFASAGSSEGRQALGPAIVNELAKTDAEAALRWAAENEDGGYPNLQMSVLATMAQTDPQRALDTALASPNGQYRQSLVSNVLQQILQHTPDDALTYLGRIPEGPVKVQAQRDLVSDWLRRDASAAVDWILQQDEGPQQQLIQMASSWLPRMDVDAAIEALPLMKPPHDRVMRQQIASRLATHRSPQEALTFIQRFAGESDFQQLQASVITGLARSDAPAAGIMAEQMPAGPARDRAYTGIIQQHAQSDPQAAMRWLHRISDESIRGMAAGQLAVALYQHNPAVASQWLQTMAPGLLRDNVIVNLVRHRTGSSVELQDLIATIENPQLRQQAVLGQIYHVMQSDPARARELLRTADVPDHQREQIEMALDENYPR